jgi:hypothetical protein
MPHPNQKVDVCLDEPVRVELEAVVRSRSAPASRVRKARVLLLADEDRREGHRPDWYIAEQVGISERQVCRIRQQFAREGLAPTLTRRRRSDAGTSRRLDGAAEAQLTALCCSDPPVGQQRWTLRLLVDELCRLKIVADVCPETVRRCLKKVASSRGRRNASAFRKKTVPGSSLTWRKSSMSTAKPTTKHTR